MNVSDTRKLQSKGACQSWSRFHGIFLSRLDLQSGIFAVYFIRFIVPQALIPKVACSGRSVMSALSVFS